MKTILLILSILLTITGCSASKRYVVDSEYSFAKNVLIAAEVDRTKMYLKDTPYEDVKQALEKEGHGKEVNQVIGVSLAGAKYGGLMTATPGISDALGGSIMLLHSITKYTYEPVQHTGHIIWMPKSYAKNTADAEKKIKSILEDAYLSSLPKDYSFTKRTFKFKPTFGDPGEHQVTNIEGGVCSNEKEVCRLVYSTEEPIEDRLTPSWLSEDKSYFWSFGVDEPPAAVRITLAERDKPKLSSPAFKPFYTHDYLETVSSKLPDWIYIYSPSTRDRQYPAVYNKGETLYFISPHNKEPIKTATNNN